MRLIQSLRLACGVTFAEITDEIAEKIYGLLLNRKVFSEENGKIIWPA